MARRKKKDNDILNGIVRCKDCINYEIENEFCRHHEVFLKDMIGNCKAFKEKLKKRDCTQCVYYNKRKNASSKCKIGIYNCKGVIK